MYIDHAGYFSEIIKKARELGAESVSIQSSYTFVAFYNHGAVAAEKFNHWCLENSFQTNGVNTERPSTSYEVAVRHKGL